MELGWLRDDLREMRGDVREIREVQHKHSERLATIESKLEELSESQRERRVIKGGVWGSLITALGALAAALWGQ